MFRSSTCYNVQWSNSCIEFYESMMVVSYCGDRGALVVRAWEEAGRAGTVCESAHKIYYFFFFFLAMMS
jgi:hypothetical protein